MALSIDRETEQVREKSVLPAPYFDPVGLRQQITDLYNRHDGNVDKTRNAVLKLFKELKSRAHEDAKYGLDLDGDGRRCAAGLSHFQDELISLLYDFTTTHVYRAQNPSDAERMAIAATGGYGRELLAPYSDVDLLFLLPYKQTAWGESVIEFMLYMLWDAGFRVGHATRSIEQCVKLSLSDMTIRTSLLDARFILGDRTLFEEFEETFAKEITSRQGRAFIEAKLNEREERLTRAGVSRYRVEPNIKDGKGGLRDLHTLHWVMKYLHGKEPGQGAVANGIFTADEFHAYRRCGDFLWTIRCHLHFLTNRAEERLTFDLQREMAGRLGYSAHAGLRGVERFMKHYFLVAKEVGDLTRIVCAALELRQLKATPSLTDYIPSLTWRSRAKLRKNTDFKIENGRITIARPDTFERNPANLIRLFQLAEEHKVPFHPDALRHVRRSQRLIDDKLREDETANAIFLKLLTASTSAEVVLRKMNEAGVLGRFIPDFGKVVAMMQFNMYHHFTVDEHLIQTVGLIAKMEQGRLEEDHPLSTEIFPQIRNSRVLYVAALLHDIAKGRDEDHSIAGARVARELCPRFGLSPSETETVAWLVENHLVMSTEAQSRDLSDPKTIQDFAQKVGTLERLQLLLILTVADIRAVGPGVWTGWKGQLLRQLYYATAPLLEGGADAVDARDRQANAIAALRSKLTEWPDDEIDAWIARQYDDYWYRGDLESRLTEAELARRADTEGLDVATDHFTDLFTAITSLHVYTQSHPALLAAMAGGCAAAGANIVNARIYTTRDGMALNTFSIERDLESDEDEDRRVGRIVASIEKMLRGETTLRKLVKGKRQPTPRAAAFTVTPYAAIDNTLSDAYSVVEVGGRDRLGLLHDLTKSLSDQKLDINSAHITTFGERAVDVFYVTDLIGKKISSKTRQESVRKALLAVLSDIETPAGASA